MFVNSNIKILVIEDNPVFTELILVLLKDIGIENISAAGSFEQGLDAFEMMEPDLLLVDIDLGKNQKTGIDFAQKIRESNQSVPLIYLTSFYDEYYYQRCRSTRPSAFMNKELSRFKLEQAIDLALQNPIPLANAEQRNTPVLAQPAFFFKVGDLYKSIPIEEIAYFFADNKLNYARCGQRNFPTSVQLKTLEREFHPSFLRIHKTYLVNVKLIESINPGENTVQINGETLPIGYAFKKPFFDNIMLLK